MLERPLATGGPSVVSIPSRVQGLSVLALGAIEGDCISGGADASLRLCCAAVAQSNASLKNISRFFHSVSLQSMFRV
jgi:hypothetical protein